MICVCVRTCARKLRNIHTHAHIDGVCSFCKRQILGLTPGNYVHHLHKNLSEVKNCVKEENTDSKNLANCVEKKNHRLLKLAVRVKEENIDSET
jgi:hypothetical protein